MEAGIGEAEVQGQFPAQVVFDQLDGLAVGHPFGETGESTPPVPGRAGRGHWRNIRPTACGTPPTPAKPSLAKSRYRFWSSKSAGMIEPTSSNHDPGGLNCGRLIEKPTTKPAEPNRI